MRLLCLTALFALAASQGVPQYVLDYAPYAYLSSSETNWPSTMSEFLQHVRAEDNYTVINNAPSPLTKDNLNDSAIQSPTTYLTSIDDPSASPQADWLISAYGKPNSTGASVSPTIIILVDKTGVSGLNPAGDLDCFYMQWYSFNLGPKVPVLNENFGDHTGDLEFTLIRFLNGKPQAVFYSQHDDGAAYTYDAVPKNGTRPITYIAIGSHANYPTTGSHDYSDTHLVYDNTDQGVAWDQALNYEAYSYADPHPEVFTALSATNSSSMSTAWLYFYGYFGDKQYPSSDPRQQDLLGLDKWTDGPLGPRSHTLIRTSMCADPTCVPATSL